MARWESNRGSTSSVLVPATLALRKRRTSHGATKGGASDGRCRQDDDSGGRQQVLLDEHADVIREAIKAVAVEMMELGQRAGRRRGWRRTRRATRASD